MVHGFGRVTFDLSPRKQGGEDLEPEVLLVAEP